MGTRESDHSLGGRVVAGGQATRQAMTRLLGVDRAPGGCQVQAVAWSDHAMEVAICCDDKAVHVFRIERRTPESRGLVLTEHLNIYSRGKGLPLSIARVVQAVASRLLADWTTDHLAAMMQRDPDLGKPGSPMPPSADEEKRPRSLLDTWGADDSFADFFAGGEISRSQLDSIDPSKLFQFVQHCDNECLFVNPHSIGSVVSLVNYPWDDRVRGKAPPAWQADPNRTEAEIVDEGMITTDMTEDDVILGNPTKLKSLIDYAVSRPNPDNKLLFVSNTCVPTVIGDDVESVVKRAQKESGRSILYLTVTPRSMTNVFHGLLVDRRLEAEQRAPAAEPHAVNLVGFPWAKSVDELAGLVASAGMKVNTRLLPDLSHERIDALPGGALNVLYPNQLWQHLYDQVLDRSKIPHMTAAAPFGLEGTRAWLMSVAGRVGVEWEAAWEAYVQPFRARWDELRSESRKYRLGLVVRDQEVYYLTTPASTWGVPLVALLEEMGFGLDVLVRVSEPKVAKEAALAIRKTFSDGARHSVRAFDSFAFLRQRLLESPARAFLSYHFFDWRLSEAGKASFSIQHFELGVPGAIRTLERLIGVCRTPFFQRYGRYLKRSAEGLRDESPDAGATS